MKRITKIEAANDSGVKKLRVAAYARVSTDKEEQLISLETQKRHYEKYIKAKPGWEYAGLYYDEGITGTSMAKRDGLMRMLEDCDKGLIDYIVVKSLSRFSRNTVESIETVRKLCEKGIFIFFEKENVDTGKMEGELLLSILSGLAESESHSISENARWGVQKRFLNGTYKISYPSYGYEKTDGKMTVDAEQAEIIRWMFNEVISGKSPSEIAEELNRKGVPTKRGAAWSDRRVTAMIHNETYTGDMLCQKTFVDDQFKQHINNGEKNKYLIRGHHEPIISHKVFEMANAMIERNGREKGNQPESSKYNNRYALSGKIRCNECGSVWKRVKQSNGGYGYSCGKHLKGRTSCSMKAIPEAWIKTAFVTMMNKLTWGRKVVLLPLAKKSRNEADYIILNAPDDLLQKNINRREQITRFFSKGLLDPAVYNEEISKLNVEAEKLNNEKIHLKNQEVGKNKQYEALKKLLHYTSGGTMLTEFNDELFSEHVDHVIVYSRNEIGFAMKCGPVFKERIV